MGIFSSWASALVIASAVHLSAGQEPYSWSNVKIGGGGGFVSGIIYNPSEKGLAYARTDIGGAYRLNNDDDTWTPLTDFATDDTWGYWGIDALATDPVEPKRLYLATGTYTNDWDPNNGHILASDDYGESFTAVELPFKVGGNMPGRGMGERLAVDPSSNNIIYFGARSGNGLYKSEDYGATWTSVGDFPSVGTYVQDSSDTSGYSSDIMGIAWVTFDSTSVETSGDPTPRVFVGVANVGEDNIFVSEDAGSTWSAVAGQNTTYLPHKGVLSPEEGLLYVSYADDCGPYVGTNGAVYKYDIAAQTWTDISPLSGADLYYGYAGLSVDLSVPGTVMVAALNSWYPDGQIWRSTDSGSTWSPLWQYGAVGIDKFYTYDDSLAPWLGPNYVITEPGTLQIGWMMESLSIDPFDSTSWKYGTGATIYGGHDLTEWDSTHNVTIKSIADGIEETAILALILPKGTLFSGVGDIGGFKHDDLTVAPSDDFQNPSWTTTLALDFAGNSPDIIVRSGSTDTGKRVAITTDFGDSWSEYSGAPDDEGGDLIAISADGDTLLWRSSSTSTVSVSQNSAAFAAVDGLPTGSIFASDKTNNSIFYAASGSSFYLSTDTATSFTEIAGALGSSSSPSEIVVNPSVSGDVWVATNAGLFHSTDEGSTFTTIEDVSSATLVSLGASATDGGDPTVFIGGTVGGTKGYFRSDDSGATFVQINDEAHGFGALGSNVLAADPVTYGRVFIGTNGRGIFVGEAA